MENLPLEIRRKIFSFVKGDEILFSRDKSDAVRTIEGVKNGELYSKALFEYEPECISVHCSKNISMKDPVSNIVSFCDFHIIRVSPTEWFYAADLTDIDEAEKNIEKSTASIRFFFDDRGNRVRIDENNKTIYTAEFNEFGQKVREFRGSTSTSLKYLDGRRVSFDKFQNDYLIERWIYSYCPGFSHPTGQFLVVGNDKVLCQRNIILDYPREQVPAEKAFDGIQENFYSTNGDYLASIYLPFNPDTEKSTAEFSFSRIVRHYAPDPCRPGKREPKDYRKRKRPPAYRPVRTIRKRENQENN